MLISAFSLSFDHPVLKGLATVGKYDGKNPCLTCGTNAGKLFVHNPHENTDSADQVTFLNMNKQVCGLVAGSAGGGNGDLLLVGTPGNLMAYDVNSNKDMFYRDMPDGVNCLIYGHVGSIEQPLAIVGGNCSIHGFDLEGNEQFWTVTGDDVSALALCDVEEDGKNELLVGSRDDSIRIFQGERVLYEISEVDTPSALCTMRGTHFGYALENGTVGVYDKTKRLWKAASKHEATAIASFDLDADGEPELLVGRANGELEVRSRSEGKIVFRDKFKSAISAILAADYRKDGHEQIIVCSASGEVRGYIAADQDDSAFEQSEQKENAALRQLTERKRELEYELEAYEENLKEARSGAAGIALVPSDTRPSAEVRQNVKKSRLEIVLRTNSTAVIRMAVFFAEKIFENEGKAIHPSEPGSELVVPLDYSKNVETQLNISLFVGGSAAAEYQVFELKVVLPRFIKFVLEASYAEQVARYTAPKPQGVISFKLAERTNRLVLWLTEKFGVRLPKQESVNESLPFKASFISLLTNAALVFQKTGNDMKILVDDIETGGDIVQDMAAFLGVTELESECSFPEATGPIDGLLDSIKEHSQARLRLTTDLAESANNLKSLLIKAEDARLLGNMGIMEASYRELYELNEDLLGGYNRRLVNHTDLLSDLKEINQTIQHAAKLRVGKAKTRVVSEARQAVTVGNKDVVVQIIQRGSKN